MTVREASIDVACRHEILNCKISLHLETVDAVLHGNVTDVAS